VWDFKENKQVIVDLGDKKKWLKYSTSVARLGFSAKRFANRDAELAEITCLSAMSAMCKEDYVRYKVGKIGLPEGNKPEVKETNGGLKMYLVCGNVNEPKDVAKHLREIL